MNITSPFGLRLSPNTAATQWQTDLVQKTALAPRRRIYIRREEANAVRNRKYNRILWLLKNNERIFSEKIEKEIKQNNTKLFSVSFMHKYGSHLFYNELDTFNS